MRCRMKAEVISLVEEKLLPLSYIAKIPVIKLKKIGQGASAEVYKVIVDLPQGVIAVKVCKNTKLAFDEYGRINFI